LALVTWTTYNHLTRTHQAGHLHGVPAFFLGVLVLLVINALVRVCVGTWKRGRRWLITTAPWRLCGWTLLFAVSTVALFYAVELWRGKRAWAAVVREAKARGESLGYETLLVPPPPDDRNFAKAPLFAPFFEHRPGKADRPTSPQLNSLERFSVRTWQAGAPFAPWLDGRATDLERCREFHSRTNRHGDFLSSTNHNDSMPPAQAAAAMLAALESYRPVMESLRSFSDRPACWFPLEQNADDMISSRAGVTLGRLLRLVQLRATAELASQEPVAAFNDVRLVLRLADYGRQRPQPSSLSHTHHHLAVVDALQPLWEGLARHCWTADQVAQLQHQLEKLDFLSDYADAVRADALTMATLVERLIPAANPKPSRELFDAVDEQRALDFVRLVYPIGWSLQDQAAIHWLHLKHTSVAMDLTARRVTWKPNVRPRELFGDSDPFFPVFITPKLWEMCAEAGESFPFAQTVVDLATLACALERHRLAHGELPTTLDALVPQFVAKLPHDIISGEPLKYRRTAGGGFVLYSVGFNKVDDGGQPSPRRRDWRGLPHPKPELDKDDWVWIHPSEGVSQ
jgi:hypothetical protein